MKGEWQVIVSGGSVTIEREDWRSYLYILGPHEYTDDEMQKVLDRLRVAEEVRDFLNGDSTPPWFRDLYQVNEMEVIGAWGLRIVAFGHKRQSLLSSILVESLKSNI